MAWIKTEEALEARKLLGEWMGEEWIGTDPADLMTWWLGKSFRFPLTLDFLNECIDKLIATGKLSGGFQEIHRVDDWQVVILSNHGEKMIHHSCSTRLEAEVKAICEAVKYLEKP